MTVVAMTVRRRTRIGDAQRSNALFIGFAGHNVRAAPFLRVTTVDSARIFVVAGDRRASADTTGARVIRAGVVVVAVIVVDAFDTTDAGLADASFAVRDRVLACTVNAEVVCTDVFVATMPVVQTCDAPDAILTEAITTVGGRVLAGTINAEVVRTGITISAGLVVLAGRVALLNAACARLTDLALGAHGRRVLTRTVDAEIIGARIFVGAVVVVEARDAANPILTEAFATVGGRVLAGTLETKIVGAEVVVDAVSDVLTARLLGRDAPCFGVALFPLHANGRIGALPVDAGVGRAGVVVVAVLGRVLTLAVDTDIVGARLGVIAVLD